MVKYKFEQIAVNCTEKRIPNENDKKLYIGLEHLDYGSLRIRRWGSDVPLKGEKLVMRKGDVLFGKRNTYLKRAAICPHDGIFSAHGMVLRPKEDVIDKDFFPFFIASEYFFEAAIRISVGSISPTVNWKDLRILEFELPDLITQRKLASIFGAINNVIEGYKDLISITDELVKSQFIEMFNSTEHTLHLKDCCSLHARVGWQALKKSEYMKSGDYMLITGTDFKGGRIDYSTCVYVSKERYDMDPHIQIQNGDILITKDGTIGKVAVVEDLPAPATLNAGVFVVRPDGRFNKGFFSYLFKGPIFADFIEIVKRGSTIKHLNQEKLLNYEIPDASIKKQEEFDVLYKQSDKSKLGLEQTLTELTTTYKRLMAENIGEKTQKDGAI